MRVKCCSLHTLPIRLQYLVLDPMCTPPPGTFVIPVPATKHDPARLPISSSPLQVDVNCKASQFAYPPPTTSEASTQASKVPTAVLSTTKRAKQKAKQKQAAKEGNKPAKGTETGRHLLQQSCRTFHGKESPKAPLISGLKIFRLKSFALGISLFS